MIKKLCYTTAVCLAMALGHAAQSEAAVTVRVQPSGSTIPAAYGLSGEERTYFGNAEGCDATTCEFQWDFSDGTSTGFSNAGNPRYIDATHTFAGSGLNWARLTVRDQANTADSSSALIEVQTLAADSTNRQKNSAIDKGLRWLYQNATIDGGRASWEWGGIGATSMALIAYENHRHNLESPDTDIYKKTVQGALQHLLFRGQSVNLTNQPCIGDPEGVPGDPAHDDGDTEHDGKGIMFDSGNQGYDSPLAMLAIVNSCTEATAKTTTVADAADTFLNGMSLWDVAVDAKDFLAYAQTDRGGSTNSYFSECWGGDTPFSHYMEGWNSGNEYQFYLEASISAGEGGVFYYSCTDEAGSSNINGSVAYGSNTASFQITMPAPNCDNPAPPFRIEPGDGEEPFEVSGYCDYYYDWWSGVYYYNYRYDAQHTYISDGDYTATGQYSSDGGENWQSLCGMPLTINTSVPKFDCETPVFHLDYGDGTSEDIFAWCNETNTYASTNFYPTHIYSTSGTFSPRASYIAGGTTYDFCPLNDIIIADVSTEICHVDGEGWRYSANYGDIDNSVSQWPTLALEEGRDRWGININPKAIATFKDWLRYSQNSDDGGFGYTAPWDWVNFPKTAGGLAMLKWAGYGPTDSNVQKALAYLDANWNVPGDYWGGNYYNMYAMYGFYKGMKYQDLNTLGSRNWEDEYTVFLINNQNAATGEWGFDNAGWIPYQMRTAMALAMLAPAVGGLPPVAEAGGPYGPVNPGQTVNLEGSGSFHQDSPTRTIVKYEWDFDSANGLWWTTKPAPDAGEGAIGINAGATYADVGHDQTYTVTLQVTDDNSPTAMTDTDTATVNVTSGNVPPVAQTDGPWAGLPGDTIVFDGSGSYDPNSCTTAGDPSCLGDTIANYEWDLDGDGTFNEGNGDDGTPVTANASKVQKTFGAPVAQSITLRVTDNYGLTAVTSPTVNIVSIALVYADTYNYCFRQVLDRNRQRLGVEVRFTNFGTGAAENVVVTLTNTPTNMTIKKGTSNLGTLDPNEAEETMCNAATQSADIELLFDRRVPPVGGWRWKAEFDFAGKHYVIDNLPPLRP